MLSRALPLTIFLLGTASAVAGPHLSAHPGNVPLVQADTDAGSDSDSEKRQTNVRSLSPADHDLFTRAFEAADRGDWPAALNLARLGQNQTARQLIEWRYLRDRNARAPFPQIDAFVKEHSDWPSRAVLLTRAEEALDPATPPAQVVAWFASRAPQSSIGMIRLGDALIATGKTAAGTKLIRDGWMGGIFDSDVELAIVLKDGAYLTPEIDRRRLDNLIWTDQLSAARRQSARVDDASQRLAFARIALRTDSKRGWKAVGELSSDLSGDPRLLFDEARAARKNGEFDRAAELLQRPAVRDLFKSRPNALWGETNFVTREMLKQGKADTAYRLVNDTGLTGGSEFADAEFLSGWISFRQLNNAPEALPHFLRLAEGVSRPISKSRAYYWQGRTYEALGDTAKAYKAYANAAAFPETFYGQLSLTRIDASPVLHLTSAKVDAIPPLAAFERDDLVKAMRVLADLGEQQLLRVFALRYLELHPGNGNARQLMQALTDMGFRDAAVRVAKTIGYDGPTFPAYAFPVIQVPDYHGSGQPPEAALVHAVIRQETEFDPQAVSRANARGIMQLTQPAAKTNARRAGLPYRPNALTTDVPYNMQLGMAELSSYLERWNGSVIVSAAAYNAGETNLRRWIQAFGDPRTGTADPLDWIESITFGETRNYVMRIVENLQVYRSRIAGRDAPLRILSDLYAPNLPPPAKILAPPPEPVKTPDQKPSAKKPMLRQTPAGN